MVQKGMTDKQTNKQKNVERVVYRRQVCEPSHEFSPIDSIDFLTVMCAENDSLTFP